MIDTDEEVVRSGFEPCCLRSTVQLPHAEVVLAERSVLRCVPGCDAVGGVTDRARLGHVAVERGHQDRLATATLAEYCEVLCGRSIRTVVEDFGQRHSNSW